MKTNLVALQIELTNACKLECAECPRHLMSRPVGVMKFDLLKLLIADALKVRKDIGFNVNGLGEPLLYPYFADMVDYMHDQGATRFELFTSLVAPSRLVDTAFAAITRNRDVKVQLAVTKHVYDRHGRRQLDDQNFEENLNKAISLHSNVDKHIGIVLNKFHTREDIDEFTERYSRLVKPSNFHIIKNLNPWFNLVRDMASLEYGASEPSITRNICDYPFILLHVGWNGDVIVCCTDDVDGDCILGRIENAGDLQRVWQSQVFEELRNKHRNYVIDMAPCNKCERTAWARV